MRGRNYSPRSTSEKMRRFWVCCRRTRDYPETGFWEVGIVLSLSTRFSRLFCGEREALGTPISAVPSAPIIRTQPILEGDHLNLGQYPN